MSRRRSRRPPESYVSRDPQRRAAQLANLHAVPPASTGRPPSHGGYSAVLVANVDDEIRELRDALAETAPLRDADGGGLPAADIVAFERAARALRRYRAVDTWVSLHGALDERTGEVKPAARLADELGRSLDAILPQLGLTPAGRMKLGLDVARAQSFDPLSDWHRRRAAPDADVDADAQEEAS